MLIIFDCDGVVLDSMILHTEIEAAGYAKLGIKVDPQEMGRRFAGYLQSEISAILEKETGIKVPDDYEVAVNEEKKAAFSARLQPIPGIREALNGIVGVPRCIASGTVTPVLDHSLKAVGLYDFFAPHIYSADRVSRGKPAPDLFLYAAKAVGFAPADCVVIEDGTAGVEAARAAGMRSIGFVGGSHCDLDQGARLTAAGAETVFSDMRDLPSLLAERFPKFKTA